MRRLGIFSALIMVMGMGMAALCAQSPETASQDDIWKGVFSSSQAERGKEAYLKNCSNCHNLDLSGSVRAPALKGDKFLAAWLNGSLNNLYSKMRFSMPANFPESVPDEVKLDVLTYVLQSNGFPAGAGELKTDENRLQDIQIVQKGSQSVPNFALVEVVGCLSRGPNGFWSLTRTSEPVVTKEEEAPAAALKDASGKPLGNLTFRLVSAAGFKPEPQQGHKVEARGLLYREANENRLNLTSLESLAPNCGP